MNDWYLKILVVGAVNVKNFGTTRLLGCQGFGMGTDHMENSLPNSIMRLIDQ